jgi:hypothetical protein
MKVIFKRFSAGATGEAGEKAREWGKKKPLIRKWHVVRG